MIVPYAGNTLHCRRRPHLRTGWDSFHSWFVEVHAFRIYVGIAR